MKQKIDGIMVRDVAVQPMWPERICDKSIVIGRYDIEQEIDYIRQHPQYTFILGFSHQTRTLWQPYLSEFAKLENILGISDHSSPNSYLSQAEIELFKNLQYIDTTSDIFSDTAREIDYGRFAKLKILKCYGEYGLNGLDDAKFLESLEVTLKPTKAQYDFSILTDVQHLRRLKLHYPKIESISELYMPKKLQWLYLEPVSKLQKVDDLQQYCNISRLVVHRAKTVKDWTVLGNLNRLNFLGLVQCGDVVLPKSLENSQAVKNGNFWGSRLSFVD